MAYQAETYREEAGRAGNREVKTSQEAAGKAASAFQVSEASCLVVVGRAGSPVETPYNETQQGIMQDSINILTQAYQAEHQGTAALGTVVLPGTLEAAHLG